MTSESSFPVIYWQCWHFILLKFENDRETSRFNVNSKHHGKPKFALKLIRLRSVYNLYPLEFLQKYQHCQLCVLGKNSNWSGNKYQTPPVQCFEIENLTESIRIFQIENLTNPSYDSCDMNTIRWKSEAIIPFHKTSGFKKNIWNTFSIIYRRTMNTLKQNLSPIGSGQINRT